MEITRSTIGKDLLRLTLRCREIDKRLSVRTTLTIDEMHCLGMIHTEKPSCVKLLSELLEVNATRTSKILWNLEQRGFVSRQMDSTDHRKELVTLTEIGQREAEQVLSLYADVGNKLLSGSSSETAQDLSRFVQILVHADTIAATA